MELVAALGVERLVEHPHRSDSGKEVLPERLARLAAIRRVAVVELEFERIAEKRGHMFFRTPVERIADAVGWRRSELRRELDASLDSATRAPRRHAEPAARSNRAGK